MNVLADTAAPLTLRYQVLDMAGGLVAERSGVSPAEALGRGRATDRPLDAPVLEIPLGDFRLWELDSPYLYWLHVVLEERGEPRDELQVRFGMRKVRAARNRIWLNDRLLYLRGALDQDFYPETSYTPPSKEFLAEQFDRALHLGLNLLRCHIKGPDPRYLEVATRRGSSSGRSCRTGSASLKRRRRGDAKRSPA